MTQLSNLRRLSLQSNSLATLPDAVSRLTLLEKLFICGNPITELPLEICALSSLTELHSFTHDLIPPPPGVDVAPPFDEKYFDSVMDAFLSRDTNPPPPPSYKILTATPYQPSPPPPPPVIILSSDSPTASAAAKDYQPKTLVARALKAEAAAATASFQKRKPVAVQPAPKNPTTKQKRQSSSAEILQGCLRRCFTQPFSPAPLVGALLRQCLSEPPPPIDWHSVLKYDRARVVWLGVCLSLQPVGTTRWAKCTAATR